MQKSIPIALLVLAMAAPASAHHAVNSQFDVGKNVAATGTLMKIELINPHSYIQFAIDDKGRTRTMDMETVAPAAMKRFGLSVRDNLKVGTTYKIVYSPSRNGSPMGLLTAITLPDGRLVAFGAGQNIDAAKALSK